MDQLEWTVANFTLGDLNLGHQVHSSGKYKYLAQQLTSSMLFNRKMNNGKLAGNAEDSK